MLKDSSKETWNLLAKKLTGDASPEELQLLERLLRDNAELHYPIQTITDIWNQASPADREQAENAFRKHLDRLYEPQAHPEDPSSESPDTLESNHTLSPYVSDQTASFLRDRKRPVRKSLFAAAALGFVGLVFAWFFGRPGKTPEAIASNSSLPGALSTVFAPAGSRTNLELPDGTKVWLNGGSRISYDKNFGSTYREVNLTGEAFFNVAPNAGKPFLIHADKIEIKVLGTRFNVKSYPSDRTTETTLIQGSIEVSVIDNPDRKIILKPNEKLVILRADSSSRNKAGPSTTARRQTEHTDPLVTISQPTYEPNSGVIIETSWLDNKLIFQDQTFRDLAKEMERHYGVSISFDDPQLEQLRFTGSFQQETIGQAMEALRQTSLNNAFNYRIHENKITINNK